MGLRTCPSLKGDDMLLYRPISCTRDYVDLQNDIDMYTIASWVIAKYLTPKEQLESPVKAS